MFCLSNLGISTIDIWDCLFIFNDNVPKKKMSWWIDTFLYPHLKWEKKS